MYIYIQVYQQLTVLLQALHISMGTLHAHTDTQTDTHIHTDTHTHTHAHTHSRTHTLCLSIHNINQN